MQPIVIGMDELEPHDPSVELTGAELRELVLALLELGNVDIPQSHAVPRMDERRITAPQIEACLKSGILSTEGLVYESWRYRATGRGITVIFTFDVDDEGNLLVVVTTWRNK